MALANFERAWCSLCGMVSSMSWEHEGLCLACVAQFEEWWDRLHKPTMTTRMSDVTDKRYCKAAFIAGYGLEREKENDSGRAAD